MLSDATLSYGEDMVRALLGVDELLHVQGGEEDDRLVVLNMAPNHRADAFAGYAAATAHFEDLRHGAATLPEADRRRYYDQLCGSTLALLEWRQGQLAFRDQISRFLHVPAEPASDDELTRLRSDMHSLLNSMGYDGDLERQCTDWETRHRVPVDEIPGTLQALLDQAWDRTAGVIDLPDPKSDGMRVTMVSGVPFNARCDYLRRTVELNAEPVLTYQALKHLAVHECYPGHYVQFKLRETWYREGTAPADGLLSIVNSASSSPFEGIADNGIRVIDWIADDDDRLASLITRYRSGIGTGAAWRLHALKWPSEQVITWLGERALVGGEGWAANRLRFIAAPQRAALIWSYWWGERSVQPVWDSLPQTRRADFLHYLYGRMHSPQTVGMFETQA